MLVELTDLRLTLLLHLTFIGEQEHLEKLSDNFGLSKQNKTNCIWSGIVDSDWKGKKVKDNFYLQSVIM